MRSGDVLALFVLVISVVPADAQIPATEREALVALYSETGGEQWLNNTNWLSGEGTECTWFGVTCRDGQVDGIVLQFNNLEGTLPAELAQFSKLEVLVLSHNSIVGNIPPALGSLPGLLTLNLGYNELAGGIPPELANIATLEILILEYTELGGAIPPRLGDLSQLRGLRMRFSHLTGSIPPELGNLSNLERLHLHGNELSGGIPPELGNLSKLRELNLMGNELGGSIPPEVGGLSSLEELVLSGTGLSGQIPSDLGNLSNLERLFMAGNRLSGAIPREFGSLSNLRTFYLGWNQLTSVPLEMTNLVSLVAGADISLNAIRIENQTVRDFFDSKDPDWEVTQTVPPTAVRVGFSSIDSIILRWNPILYADGEGRYQVTTIGIFSGGFETGDLSKWNGPSPTQIWTTENKTADFILLDGLEPDADYRVVVRTITNPDAYRPWSIISEPSEEVEFSTGSGQRP